MNNQMLDYLASKLDERCKALAEAMASGACKDFAEYQNCAGQVRGLLSARYEIDALVQKLKESDDE